MMEFKKCVYVYVTTASYMARLPARYIGVQPAVAVRAKGATLDSVQKVPGIDPRHRN